MLLARILIFLVFLGATPGLLAKGLNDLAPGSKPGAGEGDEDEEGDEEASDSQDGEEEPEPPGPVSLYLRDKLSLATSYGLSNLNKNSQKWRASGMGDLGVLFGPGMNLLGGSLLFTGRYAPMDVSPVFSKNGRTEEYKGVVEFWLFGAELWLPIDPGIRGVASAELGLGFTHLIDQIELNDENQPEDISLILALGAGVDWQILDKVHLGPRLRLGVGSFTHAQLAVNLTFAF